MKPLLPARYAYEASAMREKLMATILFYAIANRHRKVWKMRLHALLFGAGLPKLARIK